ncbi:hypothetical protein [Salisediminibacterium halotolerans]|uniref:YtkA-like n=1 Tax=Salisediminibacterium halotolerans TaxID=517425 RepID=A0A1H9UEY5_9BACI|nr:hypothetical protein [Salisediminibacterium haloalkalitolerans]SES08130.1 hypothetical protein SAMN05444126_11421 [Salisediminibacterium haloalkalitolerans]
MKVVSKSLLVAGLAVGLAACGNVENEENNNGENMNNNENNNTENNVDNEEEDNNENNNLDEENDNEADEDADTEETAELPVELIEHEGGELVFEMDGEEYSFEAEQYETDFGKEITLVDGMETEYGEDGLVEYVNFTMEDEDHELYGLSLRIDEDFNYEEGEEVLIYTQEPDPEATIGMEATEVNAAGHVEDLESHLIDDDTPYHFYYEISGNAGSTGEWHESLEDEDYQGYMFYELIEEGQYIVSAHFAEDADESVEGAAVAMAMSFQPEGLTADLDDDDYVGGGEEE